MEMIQSVVRVRGKVKILCGTETIVIPASLFRQRPLREGDTLDLEEYEQWLLLHQYRPALDCAVSMLSQRACAAGEIEQKLLRLDYRPQTIEMVLYKLSSNGLINDEDFARQWVASRARKNLGKTRIAQELRRKGVAQEDADAALNQLSEEDMLQNAVTVATKGLARAKAGEDPRKTVQRVMAQLARRGYSYALSREAIRTAIEKQKHG